MADIRQFRRRDDEGTESADRRERQGKYLKASRKRMRKIIAVLVLAGVCVLGVFYIYFRNKEYTSYSITDWTLLSNMENSQVISFGGSLIRYNSDGAACITYKNEQVWNQPFEMQNPIAAVNTQAVAIGEQGGNAVYIFNGEGIKGQIETQLPIQKIAVANNYAVAVLLKDGTTNWIYYYSSDGSLIAQMRISLDQMGYPMAMALSETGRLLAVSYLNVSDGSVTSTLSFYNFDSVGQEYTDRLVKAKSYEDTIFPAIQFINSDTAAAFGDNKVALFAGAQIPEEGAEVAIEDEIVMAFSGEGYFALVAAREDGGAHYRLLVYNASGEERLAADIEGNYTDGKIEKNKVILYSETDILIYTTGGVKKFEGSYETAIRDIIPTGRDSRYLVVTGDELDRMKLEN